ncbi:MAG: pyridine nucleotide-disulfide oxidoreductase [Hyphomicrobiaceae bacterium]
MASRTSAKSSAIHTTPREAGSEATAPATIARSMPAAVPRQSAAHTTPARRSYYLTELLVAGLVLSVIAYAWTQRLEGEITPKTGLGYMLGITGGIMMLALLLYPARKHWKPLQRAGTVRAWFTAHMFLGIAGPALVIIHSNFRLDSTNATVAMSIMLLVVASGLVGRYIYAQITEEASGRRSDVAQLLQDANALRDAFGQDMEHAPHIEAELTGYEVEAQAYRNSALGSFRAAVYLAPKARKSRAYIKREADSIISARALRERWTAQEHAERIDAVHDHFDAYFAAVQKAASLHFFARLFQMWHVLHMPLFLLLILAAVGHVIAVHLY